MKSVFHPLNLWILEPLLHIFSCNSQTWHLIFRYETDTSNFDPIDPDKLRPENEERYSNCSSYNLAAQWKWKFLWNKDFPKQVLRVQKKLFFLFRDVELKARWQMILAGPRATRISTETTTGSMSSLSGGSLTTDTQVQSQISTQTSAIPSVRLYGTTKLHIPSIFGSS